jgi:hypothetical protein
MTAYKQKPLIVDFLNQLWYAVGFPFESGMMFVKRSGNIKTKFSNLYKGTFQSEKVSEISIFVLSTNRSNISLHTALLFEFSRTKINLKASFLVVSMRKNKSRFEWLSNQRAKDCFELIF